MAVQGLPASVSARMMKRPIGRDCFLLDFFNLFIPFERTSALKDLSDSIDLVILTDKGQRDNFSPERGGRGRCRRDNLGLSI